jgi:DNA repair protein RecN (Recombination protein N)
VASFGEAARVMLALRTVLSAGDRGRTLVFDEIDSGVGGRLGPEVGAALRRLGAQHQVLCVTHLPAIAAAAPRHLAISKEVRSGRTRTRIVALEGAAREAEVADMIAGGAGEATARAEARRLLRAAQA